MFKDWRPLVGFFRGIFDISYELLFSQVFLNIWSHIVTSVHRKLVQLMRSVRYIGWSEENVNVAHAPTWWECVVVPYKVGIVGGRGFCRELKIRQKCVESRAKMRRQKEKQNRTNHTCMAMWYASTQSVIWGIFARGHIFWNSLKMILSKGRRRGSWYFYNLIVPTLDSGF